MLTETTLSPEAYHQSVGVLISILEEALKREGFWDVSLSNETLGDTLFSYVILGGSSPRQERIHELLYCLSGLANCGLVRGAGRHDNPGQFTLKRKITQLV